MNTNTLNADNFWTLVIVALFLISWLIASKLDKKDRKKIESELNSSTRYKYSLDKSIKDDDNHIIFN